MYDKNGILRNTSISLMFKKKSRQIPDLEIEKVYIYAEDHPVESLGYIRCYCSFSSNNSIRSNWQKICSWLRKSETILEIRLKATFLEEINKPIIYKFLKDISNRRKNTNRKIAFSFRLLSPAFLNTGTTNETCQQFENQDSFRQILKI